MAKFMKDLRKLCYTLPFFLSALVAQLDRAFDCGSKGQGFEFLRAHHDTYENRLKSPNSCFYLINKRR